MSNIDKKNDSIKILPVGTNVWSVRQQEWGKVTKYDNTSESYPISVMFDSRSTVTFFVADGRRLAQSELPELSLTEYNWLNGTGKFTPITDYKEEKQAPPIGTKVWYIEYQKWVTIKNVNTSHDNSYPIECCDCKIYTKDGKSDKYAATPALSLTECNWTTGTGKFTPITEWKSIN